MQMVFVIGTTISMFNSDFFIEYGLYKDVMIDCPDDLELSDAECLGISMILRMSFSLFCFHFLLFLIVLLRNECAAAFHDGCWGTKYLIVIGFYIVQCFFGNAFYIEGCLVVAKYIGAVFLLY